MSHRPFLLALLMASAAAAGGCNDDGLGGGGGGGGGHDTSGPGNGEGASSSSGDGRVGATEGSAEAGDSTGTVSGGGIDASASVGAGTGAGGGSGQGGGDNLGECPTCCVADHVVGDPRYVVRVDDSNSFASPLLVDAILPTWNGETPLPVRTHEYLNVFAPRVGGLEGELTLDVGGAVLPAPEGDLLVAFQVAVRHVAAATTSQRAVALVLDTSPSIGASVDRLLGAIDTVIAELEPADTLAVYSWAPDPARRALRVRAPVEQLDPDALRDAVLREIDLRDGAAEPGSALLAAIDEARAATTSADASVLLVSDGSAGIDAATLEAIRAAATGPSPVRVIGVGVGPAADYSDEVLDAITDASGGASLYFDGSPAAEALLGSRFGEMLGVARRGVRLRLSMPPSVSLVVTSASDASLAGDAEVEGQNLATDGTMTFHEVLRWTGQPEVDGCDAIGWRVEDADGAVLGEGSLALGDVVGGRATTPATAEGVAVVAAAAALEGPTPARLARAFAAMERARSARVEPWTGSRLEPLCTSLTVACSRLDVACDPCPSDPNAP